MNRRIFIIHGWSGSPNNDWVPWARSQLESKEYEVIAPEMPDTDNPRIEPWVNKLKEVVNQSQKEDILIGHSIGCQTILRFLEKLKDDQKINKVIFVAPWFKLKDLSGPAEWEIAKSWLETPIDFSKVKTKANQFISIFSNNDPYVPLEENKILFKDQLNSQILTLNNRGHFTEKDGSRKLPEFLELL